MHQYRKNLIDSSQFRGDMSDYKKDKKQKIKDKAVHPCVLFPATQVAPKVTAPIRFLLFILVTSPALAGLPRQLRVSFLSGWLTCTAIPPSGPLTGAKQRKDCGSAASASAKK